MHNTSGSETFSEQENKTTKEARSAETRVNILSVNIFQTLFNNHIKPSSSEITVYVKNQVPIHKISDMRDQMKENLRSTIKNNPDPALKDFINLCKKANKGIAYRYEGVQSGNTCTIEFTTDEL